MKVRSSTRATSPASVRARKLLGRHSGFSRMSLPSATSCLVSWSASRIEPSHQTIRSGWVSRAIPSTQSRRARSVVAGAGSPPVSPWVLGSSVIVIVCPFAENSSANASLSQKMSLLILKLCVKNRDSFDSVKRWTPSAPISRHSATASATTAPSAGLTLDELGEPPPGSRAASSPSSRTASASRGCRCSSPSPPLSTSTSPTCSAASRPTRALRSRSNSPGHNAGRSTPSLGLPPVKPTKGTPTETLEAIVGLHRELARRATQAIATPEEARRANTELRERMRAQDNYIPEIEELAEERVRAAGHTRGALTHREVSVMAEQLGLRLIYVNDLPHSARSVTDLANGRIYLPPASIPGGHGLRSMALQAMAHRLLRHEPPGELRRLPAAAARDQLLRGVLPDAARGRGRVPPGTQTRPGPRRRRLPRRVRRHP